MLFATLPVAIAIIERSTGIDFPANSKLGKLRSLGVRKKGPIKVYAVGIYEDLFKSKGFMLQMAMGVSAQKMTNVRIIFRIPFRASPAYLRKRRVRRLLSTQSSLV